MRIYQKKVRGVEHWFAVIEKDPLYVVNTDPSISKDERKIDKLNKYVFYSEPLDGLSKADFFGRAIEYFNKRKEASND